MVRPEPGYRTITLASIPQEILMSHLRTRIATALAALGTVTALGVGVAPQASASASSAAVPTAQDLAYLDFAARANLAEIAQGKLVKRSDVKRSVTRFATEMIRDHRQQYRALQEVASTLGVALPTQTTREQRRIVKAWRGLDGSALTCAYVPFQYGDHQLVISQTIREVEQGTEPAVVAAATASLPVLEQHYVHATHLVRGLGRC